MPSPWLTLSRGPRRRVPPAWRSHSSTGRQPWRYSASLTASPVTFQWAVGASAATESANTLTASSVSWQWVVGTPLLDTGDPPHITLLRIVARHRVQILDVCDGLGDA